MAKSMQIAVLFDYYGDILPEKQREIVEQYYNQDFSLSEIAQNEGITRQGVRDSVKRAESQMVDMEQRLGLAARLTEMRNKASDILNDVTRLREANGKGNARETVERLAQRIAARANALLEG